MDSPKFQWIPINKFTGLQTKSDPEKVDDGANVFGYNTSINFGDRISARNLGYELIGTYVDSTYPGKTLHTFRKKDGTNILIRTWGTNLDYLGGLAPDWEVIKDNYTPGQVFGFADYNIGTDGISYTYFGNAVENFSRWSVAQTTFASATANTITKQGVDTWADELFDNITTPRTVVIDGIVYTYTGGESTTTLTGVTPDPTAVAHAVGAVITQGIQEYPSNPKGNIYMTMSNRLFISGVKDSEQAVYFSKYGDVADFLSNALVTGSTATASGTFNLAEGGGGVIGMAQDEQSMYMVKRSIVYIATLTDTLYTLKPLKPFDSKSQTMGGVFQKSVFTGSNSVFLVTPDKQVLSLDRVQYIDYPQSTSISDIIKPTTDALDYSQSAGVVFNDLVFLACKSSSTAVANDVVLIWNNKTKYWESAIVGWNVADWTIYNDELYFISSLNPNVYKVTNTPNDGDYDVTSLWRSKQFDFGMPYNLKDIGNLFIEGRIAPNTSLTIKLYLDDDGFTQTYTTTFNGTETGYIYNTTPLNTFGINPFGIVQFGSNVDISGKKKFRVYLNENFSPLPFYTAQIEFSSSGQNQQWEVLGFYFKVGQHTGQEKESLYRKFN